MFIIDYSVRNFLTAGEQLESEQFIRSENGEYILILQKLGALDFYKVGGRHLWSSNTNTASPASNVFKLQGDGNLVLSDESGGVLWQSFTSGNQDSILFLHDDGQLVLYDKDKKPIWSQPESTGKCQTFLMYKIKRRSQDSLM